MNDIIDPRLIALQLAAAAVTAGTIDQTCAVGLARDYLNFLMEPLAPKEEKEFDKGNQIKPRHRAVV